MPDERKASSSSDEADHSADWESAFSAADYLHSPEEQQPRQGRAEDGSRSADKRPATDGMVDDPRPARETATGLQAILARAGNVPYPWRLFPDAVRDRLPAVTRGAILIAVSVLLLAALPLLLPGKGPSPTPQTAAAPAESPAEKSVASAARPVADEPAPPGEDGGEGAAPPVVAEKTVVLPPPSIRRSGGESQYRKWRFSPFMIAIEPEEASGAVHYVVVDLSLLLEQAREADLPLEYQYAIRDFIYQFYANRPLHELQRFALARGEMKERLQAWLDRQWPEGKLRFILFHRYKVL